ncbi:MAG TPA: aminotransferase class III-fold pyridoxal phosphate-dependent enzyme [Gaiellaceae bacterium]
MATTAKAGLDRSRIAELTEREQRRLNERTPASHALYERARTSLSGGIASSYQERDPWPIYLSHGLGSHVWDVDGNEMVDLHNGFGSMVQGHGHPAIVRAVRERVALGTHFAAPTEDAIVVSEELRRRWRLPRWRFVNSGSEATMDAIRIARARTGRETIVKIFGSYHGHHDYVMVSIGVPYERIGDREDYRSTPYGAGIPQAVADMTVPVPFNDAGAMERRIERLFEEGRSPACVIMEPAMMNLGVVLPEPGYLEAVRELTRRLGVLLIFDEVKTGLCIAAGGATERFGVTPDLVTLAKTLGGGLPSGAIGGTEEVFEVVENGSVYQVGTYNGNPLSIGRCAGEPARGADARGVRPGRGAGGADPGGLPGGARPVRAARLLGRHRRQGLRHVRPRADRRLRDVQGAPGCRTGAALLALQHEPRRVHDPGPRGGVDALGRAHGRGLRQVRRRFRGDGRGPDGLGGDDS